MRHCLSIQLTSSGWILPWSEPPSSVFGKFTIDESTMSLVKAALAGPPVPTPSHTVFRAKSVEFMLSPFQTCSPVSRKTGRKLTQKTKPKSENE